MHDAWFRRSRPPALRIMNAGKKRSCLPAVVAAANWQFR
ncbi:hypothetical protein CFter6_1782 [Collimonas fungivorans]|uniref:Uncharacterized protein n=1 Tax=Collimonas fungivorans TaxID=158899 RepID=A0A127P9I5_9BURK|nr:hypothetical protein CFter6_1782 [Collimonas fungivorans]